MPTTFNFPVIQETLDVNGDDFLIRRADGSYTRPVCAMLAPADEGNEGHTVTLIGYFGGRSYGTSPLSIQVTSATLKLNDNVNSKHILA